MFRWCQKSCFPNFIYWHQNQMSFLIEHTFKYWTLIIKLSNSPENTKFWRVIHATKILCNTRSNSKANRNIPCRIEILHFIQQLCIIDFKIRSRIENLSQTSQASAEILKRKFTDCLFVFIKHLNNIKGIPRIKSTRIYRLMTDIMYITLPFYKFNSWLWIN